MGRNVWVSPDGDGWKVQKEGGQRASSRHETKAEAREAGIAAAKAEKSEVFVQKKDGTIGERNTYGHDPRRSKG